MDYNNNYQPEETELFSEAQQPQYQPPQQPAYQEPQQPAYQQPQPQYQPQQPQYQQPQQPVYQQPQQPAYQQPYQQPVYQQPYQQPVYQQPYQTRAPKRANPLAIVSLITGIISIVLCWMPYGYGFIPLLLAIGSIVLGVLGLKFARNNNNSGKGLAIAGLICGICGATFTVIGLICWYTCYSYGSYYYYY